MASGAGPSACPGMPGARNAPPCLWMDKHPTSPPPSCAQLVIMQHKQRHHLIDKYVRLPTSVEANLKDAEVSPFLKQFYLAN